MKNSHTVVLVLVSVVATVIYMDSESPNDMPQVEEVACKILPLKNDLAPTVNEQPRKIIEAKQVTIKLDQNEPDETAFDADDKSIKPSFIIGKSKALNSKVIGHHLQLSDFDSVISNLTQFQTLEEIEREYELIEAINDESNFSGYPYNYGCGGGICAVELSHISNEELEIVSQLIPETMNFKAFSIHTITELGGTNSIRIIGGASPETNSMTLDISSMKISNLE